MGRAQGRTSGKARIGGNLVGRQGDFPGTGSRTLATALVTLFNTYPKAGVERDGSSLTNYYERRGDIAAFSGLAIYREDTAIVGDAGSTEREPVMRVSPDFFSTLGVGPAIGRAFAEEETTFQTDNVVILTISVVTPVACVLPFVVRHASPRWRLWATGRRHQPGCLRKIANCPSRNGTAVSTRNTRGPAVNG